LLRPSSLVGFATKVVDRDAARHRSRAEKKRAGSV